MRNDAIFNGCYHVLRPDNCLVTLEN